MTKLGEKPLTKACLRPGCRKMLVQAQKEGPLAFHARSYCGKACQAKASPFRRRWKI